LLHIQSSTKLGSYNRFEDVATDYPYRGIVDKRLIREIIRDSKPVDTFDLVPSDVIWIYGKSGSGKSCYTDQMLKDMGYSPYYDITFLKSDRVTPL